MPTLNRGLTPSAPLRGAMNIGNPVLAQRNVQSGRTFDVSVDSAALLAQQLGRPLGLVVAETAAASFKLLTERHANGGFLSIDPLRARELAFSPPYLLIEGCYAVRREAELHGDLPANEELCAVQLLLGHSKLKSPVRYLGIEVDDVSEQMEI